MNRRTVMLIFVMLCAASPAFCEDETALRLHLPRVVCVADETLTVGRVGVLTSQDIAMLEKASGVELGRAPASGETIVLSRQTILSRLATAGVEAGSLRVTGAEAVSVTREENRIEADKLVASAESFMAEARPVPLGCTWKPVRRPNDLVVPAGDEPRLVARLAGDAPPGCVSVEVSACMAEQEVGRETVLFRLIYPARKAFARRDIAEGEVLTEKNVEMKVAGLEGRQPEEWVPPYGKITSRRISAGDEIRPSFFEAEKAEVIIKRNERVQMKIEGVGFLVTAVGTALQDGRCGDLIKVRNVDTERIVTARVASDGTVRPVCENEVKDESGTSS